MALEGVTMKKAAKILRLSRRQSKEKSGVLACDVAPAACCMLVHGVPSRESSEFPTKGVLDRSRDGEWHRQWEQEAGTLLSCCHASMTPQCSKNAGSWFLLTLTARCRCSLPAAHWHLACAFAFAAAVCCLLCGV
jgi:hypothetical protein